MSYPKLTLTAGKCCICQISEQCFTAPCGHKYDVQCFAALFAEELKGKGYVTCEESTNGESGGPACGAKIDREVLLTKIGFTNKEFEKEIALAYQTMVHYQQRAVCCPKCNTFSVRKNPNDQRVRCGKLGCFQGSKTDWCFYCGKPWLKPESNVMCGNECDGRDPVLTSLQTCELKTITYNNFSVQNVPSIRLCPCCGVLLGHLEKCKLIHHCPRCTKGFCFICLTPFVNGQSGCTAYNQLCPKGVAARQTAYPNIS